MVRRERPATPVYINGTTNGAITDRIPHSPEKDLQGGANWVVQKFGGTSVGKFAVKIAEDIVLYVSALLQRQCLQHARSEG